MDRIKKNQPVFFLLYISGIAEEIKPNNANNIPIWESYSTVIKIAKSNNIIVMVLQILVILLISIFSPSYIRYLFCSAIFLDSLFPPFKLCNSSIDSFSYLIIITLYYIFNPKPPVLFFQPSELPC